MSPPVPAPCVTVDHPRFRLPVMSGVIDRRMLVNFRVRPEVIAAVLPAPFRPKLMKGSALAGICLIRLRAVRPRGFPAWLGAASENAAHRIAVEWDEGGGMREGVYIPRRDTDSWLSRLGGGRIFPGEHRAATFHVEESGHRFLVEMRSADGRSSLRVSANVAEAMPADSIFGSVAEASAFFEGGALGWSATRRPGAFDGLELRTFGWRMEPLAVDEVTSSFFSDAATFPPGSAVFDSALLMRGLQHEWHGRGVMTAAASDDSEMSMV